MAAARRAAPRPARPLPVAPWARAYGLIPAPGGGPHAVPLIGPGPEFDPEYAMTTDLDEPVIIASVTIAGSGPPAPLLNDGTHHLYKADPAGRSPEQIADKAFALYAGTDLVRDSVLTHGDHWVACRVH